MNVFDPRFHAWLSRETGIDPASLGNDFVARALAERIAATQPGAGGEAAQAGRPQPAITDEAVDAYWQCLNASADERRALIELFVVPETWFFREREAFAALARLGAQRLFAEPARALRILSAPCSTGEEPYSAAMALLDAGIDPSRFEIDALDISARAIAHAQRGRYGRNSFRGHVLGFRDLHFKAAADGWVLDERVRACVRFRQANLLDLLGCAGEPYDFVFCRNVLIYFDRDAQDRVVRIVEEQLDARGILFVGPAETGVVMRQGLASAQIPLAFAFRKPAVEAAARPGAGGVGARRGGAAPGGAANVVNAANAANAGAAAGDRVSTFGGTLRAIAHEWFFDAGWPTPEPIVRAIDGARSAFESFAASPASAQGATRFAPSEPRAQAGDAGERPAGIFARAPGAAEPGGERFARTGDAGRFATRAACERIRDGLDGGRRVLARTRCRACAAGLFAPAPDAARAAHEEPFADAARAPRARRSMRRPACRPTRAGSRRRHAMPARRPARRRRSITRSTPRGPCFGTAAVAPGIAGPAFASRALSATALAGRVRGRRHACRGRRRSAARRRPPPRRRRRARRRAAGGACVDRAIRPERRSVLPARPDRRRAGPRRRSDGLLSQGAVPRADALRSADPSGDVARHRGRSRRRTMADATGPTRGPVRIGRVRDRHGRRRTERNPWNATSLSGRGSHSTSTPAGIASARAATAHASGSTPIDAA
ncbi:cheR methyltransferase, SAM binding domain protein [Burkholderia pseudomallei TSV 48]|nr:cheR methyltransferase, SAM binding domain protein [Burkholderia pseudomallei TSV 48]